MTINHTRLIGILLLVSGMFIAPQVAAIEITSVDPPSAPQDTPRLDVHIYGNGFNSGAEVTFHLDDSTTPAPGITVNGTRTKGSGEIIANIDIAPDAKEADYTLQVMQQRRGGKGTTYEHANAQFKVTGKPQGAVACGGEKGVFREIDEADCDCEFTSKLDGGAGKPNNLIWILQNDCSTSKTLKLGQYETLNGNGKTLTAIPPAEATPPAEDYEKFRSVITNSGHRAQVFLLNILVQDDVDTGCATDGTVLNSAISFVLDDTKEHPEDTTDFKGPEGEGDTYPTSWLRAWDIKVTSANPLCRAIELRRDFSYDTTVLGGSADYPDLVANVQDVWITSGSYEDAGVQLSGFVNSGQGGRSGEKISILKSTVMGAAGSTGSAIRFGPVNGQGTVGQNAVSANGGTGISVDGDVEVVDEVTIENNNVEGAATAISVDGAVDKAYFKSNVLVGDSGAGVGIDTYATDNVYRSNQITGFACAVDDHDGDCEP